MRTIILCGGRGWRMNEETEFKPKAMVKVGEWPVLVHIMETYAKWGHRDFLLCLGYKGEQIRQYFFNVNNYENDVALDLVSGKVDMLTKKAKLDYKISFIETGLESDTAERVLIAAEYVDDDRFMVSYGDDVSNVNIEELLKYHDKKARKEKIYATITAAHPSSHYGKIWADRRDVVRRFVEKPMMDDYVNGGFMVFDKKGLAMLRRGETLEEGLERMAKRRRLAQYKHEGFWHAMNTMKDVQYLNELWERGKPWTKRA